MLKPIHPESGQPFAHPSNPGLIPGVVGWCGHRVAESEWRARFRVCERDQASDYEPPDGALVLRRSIEGSPYQVWTRDDKAAAEAVPDFVGERWFKVGDDEDGPSTWTVVCNLASDGGGTLARLMLADREAERATFAAAIANVAVLETGDLDRADQIKAAVARGDGAESMFYAGAKAMLDLVHAALREGAPEQLAPQFVAEDEVSALCVGEPAGVAPPSAHEVMAMIECYARDFVDTPRARTEIEVALQALRDHAPKRTPLPAAEQPVGAIVATDEDVYRKNLASGSRPWCSPDSYASNEHIDGLLADGAELLRGEVAR